jgi:hypothetical protein
MVALAIIIEGPNGLNWARWTGIARGAWAGMRFCWIAITGIRLFCGAAHRHAGACAKHF